jgi:hypothetical protein
MSRRKVASIAFTGAAAAGAVMMVGPGAHATSGKWIITGSKGKIANSTHYSASNSTKATLSAGTVTLSCPKSTASTSGKLFQSKTGTPPVQIGTIAKANFGTGSTRCNLGGFHFSAKLNKTPLKLNAKTYAAPVTTGSVTGSISATIHGVGGFACTAVVTGTSIPASFNNTTHHLTVNPGTHHKTLHVKTATGCPGVTASQSAGFAATYHITAPTSLKTATIVDP